MPGWCPSQAGAPDSLHERRLHVKQRQRLCHVGDSSLPVVGFPPDRQCPGLAPVGLLPRAVVHSVPLPRLDLRCGGFPLAYLKRGAFPHPWRRALPRPWAQSIHRPLWWSGTRSEWPPCHCLPLLSQPAVRPNAWVIPAGLGANQGGHGGISSAAVIRSVCGFHRMATVSPT